MNINDKEKVGLLAIELKSIIECISDYWENPEGVDIPIEDILDSIVEDAEKILVQLDLD